MIHPAIAAAILVGGVFIAWGGYEIISRILEEREERRQYEEYIRRHNEKWRDEHDSDGEYEAPRAWYTGRQQDTELRYRGSVSPHSSHSSTTAATVPSNHHGSWQHASEYELSEMERSIWERRQRLQMEQALLDQAEEDLERRRRNLSTRGNSVIGVTPDYEPSSQIDHKTDKEEEKEEDQQTPAGSQVVQDIGPRLDTIQDPWALHANDTSDDDDDLSAAFQNSMQFPKVVAHTSDSEESWANVATSPATRPRGESDISDLTFESRSPLHEDDSQSYDMLSTSSDEESTRRLVAH